MPITNLQLAALKPSGTVQKLFDGQGLYLYVPANKATPASFKLQGSWRYDYRFGGKRYTLTLGRYPLIPLRDARALVFDAKRSLAAHENPALTKRKGKLNERALTENSFKEVAQAWYESKQEKRSASWRELNALYLRRDLNPSLGPMPVSEISKQSLIAVLKNVSEKRGIKVAERVRQAAVQVFDYAIRNTKIEQNVARLLKGWVDVPPKVSHSPLDPNEIQAFLEATDRYAGQLCTKLAIKLLLLTFVRKRELVEAPWSEFNLEARLWTIPASRMKAKATHRVPLSEQAVTALRRLHEIAEGSSYVFPNLATADKPMSASTLNVAFANMGYKGQFSPHGVRTTASTWLNEQGFRADVIERQLAHTERNSVRAAYNQADYLSERAGMMQAWADFVDPKLKLRKVA